MIIFFFGLRNGKSFLPVLKSFFAAKLFSVFLSLVLFAVLIVFILYQTKFWDFSLLKDTTFWFISSAMILFFNINKAHNTTYFKKILNDNFKAFVILEFLLNFYTFSLLTEMLVIPIITFITILKLFAENSVKSNPEHEKVVSCLNSFINIFGLFLFLYVTYKTFFDYSLLLQWNNLKSFLLPLILTLLIIPYFYLLALYIKYENLFIRINLMYQDKKRENLIKKFVLFYANLNLNKLDRISNGLNKFDLYHSKEIKKYIKKLSKKNLPITVVFAYCWACACVFVFVENTQMFSILSFKLIQ